MTLDEAIKHCEEVAEKNENDVEVYEVLAKNHKNTYSKLTATKYATDCVECAADHRQLAEWLTELQQKRDAVKHLSEWNRKLTDYKNEMVCKYGESQEQLKEAKRLLRLAVKDFALLDRDYSIDGGCTLRDVCCEDCPLNNEKDEPCHEWRFKGEAEKLLGKEI